MKRILLLLFLSILSLASYAQHATQKIDELLQKHQQKGRFDGTVLLAKNGNIIYQRQFGLANRQFNVPISSSTRFPVASITKLYAAILVLKLQEQGKLHIDSPIFNYTPHLLPKNNKKITIRQLLVHTAGLPNERIADYTTQLNAKNFIQKRIADTLLSTPGITYRYNNVNFILLTAIMEQVSGKKWADLLADVIIKPLKLQQTGVVKRDSVIKNLAYGYHNYSFGNEKVKDPLENDDPLFLENYAAAGAIFTTPIELLKLNQALATGKILNPASLALLYEPNLKTGKGINTEEVTPGGYLKTLSIGDKKIKAIERNGNIMGYNATYLQLPESKQVLIVFCNTDANDLSKIALEILAIAL
ncbi:serine hydrolase domain-containing protein [Pedobacter sp. KR3-3]|uniref:Serine hydrolase domain-containing protein n=1 Tax=Pedobacter albus TaxID=3113905 RepID=A0ABU7I486_9SPHI|nr:serine hydrolase domain-containing protein [Pedobacter sp. KR3-3]MEE1944212.1 serine hydrolase domain-containing protein [Pedobacter sp. KR3-3]